MRNLFLSIIAICLFVIIEPISFLFVVVVKKHSAKKYWRSFAVDVDRFGNHQFRTFFNAVLKTADGYPFGDFRETVSSALGKNQRDQTLSRAGKMLVKILDTIDKNHCEKSILEL